MTALSGRGFASFVMVNGERIGVIRMYICRKCGEEAVPNNYIAGYYCYNCRNLGFNEVCSDKEIYKEWLECKSLCTMTSKETGETKDSETVNQCEEDDDL